MSAALEEPIFNRDESIARWREHSISLDRNKCFTLTPNVTFLLGLSADAWVIFNYYHGLAPTDHPGEELTAPRLRMGRATLRGCIAALQKRGMIFCDYLKKNRQRIVHIAHPGYWKGLAGIEVDPDAVNPHEHKPRTLDKLPERLNQARDYFSKQPDRSTTRLPNLLFQAKMISSTARMLYGIICWLPVYDHPTTVQLAAAVGCSEDTAGRHLAQLVECRMIDFTVREPGDFGDHRRYYYHTYDVSQWRCRAAQKWYGVGRSSLADLDAAGRLAIVKRRPVEGDDDFEFCDRPALRLIATQHGQTVSSQPATQHGQNASQHGQNATQHGQPASWIIEKSSSIPGGAALTGQAPLPNKIEVRKYSSKEDSCNSRAPAYSILDAVAVAPNREPACSVPVPRIINIANAAGFVWESQSYKYDRPLWTDAVKDVIIERGEDGGLEFCEFVIRAFQERGRKLPYDPLTIRKLKSDFLGRVPATIITVVPTEVAAVAANPALECEILAHPSHSSAIAPIAADDGTLPLPLANVESVEPVPVSAAIEPQPESVDLPVPTDRDPLGNLPGDDDRLRWLVGRILPKLGKHQKADLRDLWTKHGPLSAVRCFAGRSPENRLAVMGASAELQKIGILRKGDIPQLPWEPARSNSAESVVEPASTPESVTSSMTARDTAEPVSKEEVPASSMTANHSTLISDFQSRQARMVAGEKAAEDAPITRARLNHAITVLTRDYKFATRVSMARGFEKLCDADLWSRLVETFTETRLREVLRDIP